jgi:hypothetical protein
MDPLSALARSMTGTSFGNKPFTRIGLPEVELVTFFLNGLSFDCFEHSMHYLSLQFVVACRQQPDLRSASCILNTITTSPHTDPTASAITTAQLLQQQQLQDGFLRRGHAVPRAD